MDETELVVKIKQEKLTPERPKVNDGIEKLLDANLFGDKEENEDKKDVEPTKTSDQLLEELFGVFGANINILNSAGTKEKKSKKKKKRKHDDSDGESTKSKAKKAKKAKKMKKEADSDKEDSKEHIRKKIKKEKEEPARKEVTERRKLSIIIKDSRFKSEIMKPSSSKSSTSSRDKEREREKEKRRKSKEREKEKDRKSREKKSSGNVSDVSLSDEETYRKMLEYHTSEQWLQDRNNHVREWDRDKYRRGRSRDDDRHSRHYRGHRSRSRSRKRSPIDKKRLLEIARKNAISMLKSGTLPRNISENAKEKLISKITHGGKSIEELTNYCKRLSKAEDLGDLSSLSDSDNDGDGKPRAFHHPFEVKDRGPIVMNIRNSVPIVPKQASELKAIMSQFPVSSGKQHQKVENTWVPVTTPNTPATVTTVATIPKPIVTLEKQIQEQLPELARPKPPPMEPPKPLDPALSRPYDWKSDDHYLSKSIIPELAPPPQPPVDVSDIISQRLNAMRKLQENPNDCNASQVLFETQQNMSQWAQSKYTPGQFLGSTDVRVLSQKELATGNQAWARKNQLIDTVPVTSGMGMHLLKKMGWCPGEGLGKEKNGSLTPLLLELKLDKRGLEANEEVLHHQKRGPNNMNKVKKGGGPRGGNAPVPMANLESKHPVSLLGELASKRKWGAPNYTLVFEQGPAHAKNFIFKVRLNGIDYTSPASSNNKKEAKSCVAKFCLQQLGILPS